MLSPGRKIHDSSGFDHTTRETLSAQGDHELNSAESACEVQIRTAE